MNSPGKHLVAKRVIIYEIIAFLSISLVIWLDEIFDMPHLLLGAEATPVNWRESLLESIGILILGLLIIRFTHRIIQRMKYLEGIITVCASCKKIMDDEEGWRHMESFLRERTDAEFSHGICPECAKKLYPQFFK